MSVFMSYPSKRIARGPASRAKSNRPVGSLNLHDWCFRLAQRAPSLYGATEGSASEAADVRLERFGLSRGLSAAAESAFPEGAIASILRDAFGGERCPGQASLLIFHLYPSAFSLSLARSASRPLRATMA